LAEYAIIVGLKLQSLLSLESFTEIFLVLGCGIGLTVGGYMFHKGTGASIALLSAAIVFLYLKGFLN
jgi:hypothetical protein